MDNLLPAIIEEKDAKVAFSDGTVDAVVDRIAEIVKDIQLDVTTTSGRKEIASVAFKIARSKTLIDNIGKEVKAEWAEKVKEIDGIRRKAWDRLEKLQSDVRKPLDDFEQAEKDRVDALQSHINAITALAVFDSTPTSDAVAQRLQQLGEYPAIDWQEFAGRAEKAVADARVSLEALLADRRKAESEAAELARLRAEAEVREREDRERRIAEEAATKAKAEAEERIVRMEAEAKAAAEKAEADRIAAVEKAQRDAEAAVRAEQARVEAERAAQDAEEARRTADIEHRRKINRAVLDALASAGITEEQAKEVLKLIVAGKVPSVKINY